MNLPQIFGVGALVIFALLVLLWLLSLALKDASIIDSFWGAGFVIVNWVYYLVSSPADGLRALLLGVLVTLWGLRLSIHIYLRNRGKGEDFRYAKWRAEEGPRWWWLSFIRVFLLQGILLLIISAPLLAVHAGGARGVGLLDWIGAAVWLVGFFFEAVGDVQLARFKADPRNKGKIMDRGLWRTTRHPNYFGDAAQWWGYYLIAAAAGGWWAVFSPLLMTFLLVRVSGAALLERTLKEQRPGYKEYIAATSGFIPWFPRKQNEKRRSS
jgi:steroid 5-alpha reductase family enzyme